GLPEWALISIIEPSPHDPAVAYLAAHRYKLDDFQPYLYKTDDYGKHWTPIAAGLPGAVFARVIREDPARRGLLYCGTETGIHVSFDDGLRWQPLQLNLPVVPVHDLVIKDSDLVVATHGRSFWVLDDLTPVRQMSEAVRAAAAHLFAIRPAVRFAGAGGYSNPPIPNATNYQHTGAWVVAFREEPKSDGETTRRYLDAGQNPHDGAYITYALKQKPEGEVTLTFLDAAGREIRSFSSEERKQRISLAGDARLTTGAPKLEQDEPRVPKEAGMNRFYWDLRYPPARPVDGFVTGSGVVSGPAAPPGRYQARLTVGDQTLTEWFEVRADPRVDVAQADLEAQFALLLQVRDKISETHDGVNMLKNIRRQVEEWERRTEERPEHADVARAGQAVKEKLGPIEDELIAVKATEGDDTLRIPVKLNFKLAELMDVAASADAAPTRQAREAFAALSSHVDEQLRRLREVIETDLAAFNALVRDTQVPAVVPSAALPPLAG
ncbi:MAG TPA: hypothetical protein VF916_12825, partial [Ktedonobacterales bacterium]